MESYHLKFLSEKNMQWIENLSDSNGIWTHNHLVHKRTLKPLCQTGQMI